MNKLLTGLGLVLVLASALAAPLGAFEVGQSVAAKWTDGNMYLATIAAVDGDSFKVDYADGDKGTVTADQMVVLEEKPALAVGDRVMAVWGKARFYPGVVTAIKSGGPVVKWDDGSAPIVVAWGKVYKEGAGADPGIDTTAGGKKRVVMAKWTDGNWYLATVTGKDGDVYLVDYADGDKGRVTKAQLKRIPAKIKLNVGDKVWAVYGKARFYTAVVEETRADGAVVKWDDGTAASFVPFGKIAKQ